MVRLKLTILFTSFKGCLLQILIGPFLEDFVWNINELILSLIKH